MVFVMTSFLLSSLPTRMQFHWWNPLPIFQTWTDRTFAWTVSCHSKVPHEFLQFIPEVHQAPFSPHSLLNNKPIKTDEPFKLILLPQVSCSALATTLNLLIISLCCFHVCCFPIKYCEIQSSTPGYQDQCWHKEPISNTCYWSFCFISILAYNDSVSFLEKMINRSVSITKRDKSAPHTTPPPQAPAARPVKATLRAFALSTSLSASLQPASFWAPHPSLRLEGSRK